jgi:hypothetical protein
MAGPREPPVEVDHPLPTPLKLLILLLLCSGVQLHGIEVEARKRPPINSSNYRNRYQNSYQRKRGVSKTLNPATYGSQPEEIGTSTTGKPTRVRTGWFNNRVLFPPPVISIGVNTDSRDSPLNGLEPVLTWTPSGNLGRQVAVEVIDP